MVRTSSLFGNTTDEFVATNQGEYHGRNLTLGDMDIRQTEPKNLNLNGKLEPKHT